MSSALVLPAFVPSQPAVRVDAALREALAACDRARECAVLWFAEVQRRGLHRELGHASLELYATQALGFSLNRYWQFKRLADDLERLPELRDAVADGSIGWTKAQQVARVATPATQTAWVARAATTGRRELAQEVRAARVAQRAPARVAPAQLVPAALAPAQPELERAAPAQPEFERPAAPQPAAVTITLRGDALHLARFEALVEKVRRSRRVPAAADRMELVLAGLEALVGAEPAQGASRPSVQVVVQRCPDCAGAAVVTGRGELPLTPGQTAAVACDALVREPGRPNRATIPPRVRAAVLARDRHRCATPGCRATLFLEVHHRTPRHRGGSNVAENLVTLCNRCHAFVHAREAGEAVDDGNAAHRASAAATAPTCAGATDIAPAPTCGGATGIAPAPTCAGATAANTAAAATANPRSAPQLPGDRRAHGVGHGDGGAAG